MGSRWAPFVDVSAGWPFYTETNSGLGGGGGGTVQVDQDVILHKETR